MAKLPRSPWTTDELEELRELAHRFYSQEVAPNRDNHIAQGHPDRALYRRAGDLGLVGISIPEAYGGGGGTFAHEAVLIEEQVRAGDDTMAVPVHAGIIAHYLNAYGSEEQKMRWLPKLCSGEWVSAVAMTEPGAGSDLQGIKTKAVKDGDDYVISGAKTFITNGALCDLVVIVCRTSDAPGAAGISLVVAEVDDQTPGFERGRVLHKIGLQGQDTAELFFDGLRVPQANLLGADEGMGFIQLMQQLPQERLIIAGMAVASMEVSVKLTVDYTKSRHAFGKPLMSLQNTRFELAECHTIASVARSYYDQCVVRHVNGELDVATAAMAKYWCTEQQGTVIDRCVQLFGGYGYMAEYPISQIYTAARITRIFGGANEVMKELIARGL